MNRESIDRSSHAANIAWREKVYGMAASRGPMGAGLRLELEEACREDIVFWLNAMGYTFDPRRAENDRAIPWVTYPFQEEAIPQLVEAIGKEDVGVEKSRTMTATWMILAVFVHQWQFRKQAVLGVASSKEKQVDNGEDPDSLFWKLRFLVKYQPQWLLNRKDYLAQKLVLKNHKTGGVLNGYSTTEDIGRGGRKLAFMIDEFAAYEFGDGYAVDKATYAVTNSRIFNSTYKGAAGCFYDKIRGGDPVPRVISLPWWKHPEYGAGLYYDDKGRARSPWYDRESVRIVVEAFRKSELDMDPMGSMSQFFPSDLLERLMDECRKPYLEGRLEGNRFLEQEGGPLRLWFYPRQGRVPFGEQFAAGADISMGTGTTNSVCSVAARKTGEKVAELVHAHRSPVEFAQDVVALCRWFNEAFLIWELQGPGVAFGSEVVKRQHYGNIYYRKNEQSVSGKITDHPGWNATDQNKRLALSAYITALQEGTFVNRSREALEECRLITLSPEGRIVNSRAMASADPSGARENHADRPTADLLCCKALGELGPPPEPINNERPPLVCSLEGRRQLREQETRKADEW